MFTQELNETRRITAGCGQPILSRPARRVRRSRAGVVVARQPDRSEALAALSVVLMREG